MSFRSRAVRQHVVADRVHQVRLAQADAAVEKQRVVRPRRRFGDRAARRVRELIRGTDDERVERVARTETDAVLVKIRRLRARPVVRGGAGVGATSPSATNSSSAPARPTSASASSMTPA